MRERERDSEGGWERERGESVREGALYIALVLREREGEREMGGGGRERWVGEGGRVCTLH